MTTTPTIVPSETQLQRPSGLHPELQSFTIVLATGIVNFLFEEVDANKIGDPTKHNLCKCLKDGKGYMFPAKFHGLAAKEKLVIELKLAALKAGFCLVISSSKGLKSLPATTRRCASVDEHVWRTMALAVSTSLWKGWCGGLDRGI
ncbi:hypothetical protein IV203_033835 [Nitzschia inconspicua]|uniref:Uncharacterized protein n=1 Tax=Nitzschia inconspicua TaxID=303405 RepID=A0A9K3M6Q6_9STRA|nr:hypothetical protein IV203_033835 [Nitzschia inconspicua]